MITPTTATVATTTRIVEITTILIQEYNKQYTHYVFDKISIHLLEIKIK